MGSTQSIVHFNYVITTYRLFQRHGPGMVDDCFRLLLIRVFIDLFASDLTAYTLPTMSELADGLTAQAALVKYPDVEQGSEDYATFRTQLEEALSGSWAAAERRATTRAELDVFDDFYGWVPTKTTS